MEQPRPAVHRTIVVVDVEGFGDRRRTNAHQVAVRDGLYRVLGQAFENAGLPWTAWDHEDRGDGVFILAPAEMPKAPFVDGIPPALARALHQHNITHDAPERIRLRMALHAGEVAYDDHGVTAASVNLAFRLLDAQPLKAALAQSLGLLALIVSGWFFDEVVRHSRLTDPTTFRPVPVTVKETTTVAWISLPDHPYPSDPTQLEHFAKPSTYSVPALRSLVGLLAADHLVDRPPVPRQLPLAIRDFTGRAEHLAALDALLPGDPLDSNASETSGTVVISAVDGAAGIGKTTLALYWAHRAQHRFPDGTLHVNLRGYGPGDPATPDEVLNGFLRALGIPAEAIPTTVEAQAALFRSALVGRRVLVVLDNANSADQVRPLLPGNPGCVVVVTSRESLTGLVITEGAHQMSLDLLTQPEALALVTGIIGPHRSSAEPGAVAELIRICARLPLALRITATRAATPHITVAKVVAELADEHSRLDVLSQSGDERTAVRTVFDWSYQRLDTQHARLFRRLGLHFGPDLSLYAAAAVADLEPSTARALLDDLARAHVIEPIASGRYRFHDLLRVYAADQATRHDTTADRDHARRALLDWYAHTARTCDVLLYPAHFRLPQQPRQPTYPTPIPNRESALAWLDTERDNLLAALRHSSSHDLHHHTLLLTDGCRFLLAQGPLNSELAATAAGLAAARQCGDRTAESWFHLLRGESFTSLGRWDLARTELDQARTVALELGDQRRSAGALADLGWLAVEQGRFVEAVALVRPALPLIRGTDTGRLEALMEGILSRAYTGLGDYREALVHGEQGLALRRQCGDLLGEALALHSLALAQRGQGDYQQAIALCWDAITIGRRARIDLTQTVAAPLDTLAQCLHSTGDTPAAIECWQEAASIYDTYGRPHRADRIRERLYALNNTEPTD